MQRILAALLLLLLSQPIAHAMGDGQLAPIQEFYQAVKTAQSSLPEALKLYWAKTDSDQRIQALHITDFIQFGYALPTPEDLKNKCLPYMDKAVEELQALKQKGKFSQTKAIYCRAYAEQTDDKEGINKFHQFGGYKLDILWPYDEEENTIKASEVPFTKNPLRELMISTYASFNSNESHLLQPLAVKEWTLTKRIEMARNRLSRHKDNRPGTRSIEEMLDSDPRRKPNDTFFAHHELMLNSVPQLRPYGKDECEKLGELIRDFPELFNGCDRNNKGLLEYATMYENHALEKILSNQKAS